MLLDKTRYHNLESLFRAQVERDKAHAIERVVQGWGVYLPSEEPKFQVDYIFVGMEPSFGWADSIEDAEGKIAEGFRNNIPDNPREPLALFILSIKQFLCKCQSGETYHLTDVSKGAMPGTVAALDRERRYKEWYPLLLEEIAIVGKHGAPVIAVGKQVKEFLQQRDLARETGRPLYDVQHYSFQAARYFKLEAERDPVGFELFQETEFGKGPPWPEDLSLARKQLVFAYKKQFESIRTRGRLSD